MILVGLGTSCFHSPRQNCLNGEGGKGNSYSAAIDSCKGAVLRFTNFGKANPTPEQQNIIAVVCANMIEEEKKCNGKSNIPYIPADPI